MSVNTNYNQEIKAVEDTASTPVVQNPPVEDETVFGTDTTLETSNVDEFVSTTKTEAASMPVETTSSPSEESVPVEEGAKVDNSAEMERIKSEIDTQTTEKTSLDKKIEENNALIETVAQELGEANIQVTTAKQNYEKALVDYAAAQAELAELQNSNFISKLLNSGKIKELESKVQSLKEKADKAEILYEKAVENQQEKNEELTALREEKAQLTSESEELSGKIDELNGQYDELANEQTDANAEAVDENAETDGDNNSVAAGTDTTDTADVGKKNETDNQVNKGSGTETDPAASSGLSDDYLDNLQNSAEQSKNDFENRATTKDYEHFNNRNEAAAQIYRDFGIFMSEEEISTIGLTALGIPNRAGKIIESRIYSSAFSKSASMAAADGATSKEHSEAQAAFTEVCLDLSDVINGSDVEFYNITDESNYELAMNLLERISSGEYIKTSTLEQQTSIVKNIQVSSSTEPAYEANDTKYEEFSEAILDELKNPFDVQLSDEEYEAIEREYDALAVRDMESAYNFLIDQANKYNIDEAIAA